MQQRGHHVAQPDVSQPCSYIADIYHLQAYPPRPRPTLAPSLTTTLIYTLGANARRAARRNGECFHRSRSGRRRRLKVNSNTHRHPLSVAIQWHLVGRSWTASAERAAEMSRFSSSRVTLFDTCMFCNKPQEAAAVLSRGQSQIYTYVKHTARITTGVPNGY